MTAPKTIMHEVGTDEIFVCGPRRPLDEGTVKSIIESIAKIGLQTPISVRLDRNLVDPERPEDGEVGGYELIAGLHRLEACKRSGMKRVPIVEWPEDTPRSQIEMWEIVENLHRADLSKEQRDIQIRRFAELMIAEEETAPTRSRTSLSDGRASGPQHEKGTASKIAEQMGLKVRTVQRALNPAPPKPAIVRTPSDFPTDDHEKSVKWRRQFERVWNDAPTADDKEWAKEWIDRPLMDKRYGT